MRSACVTSARFSSTSVKGVAVVLLALLSACVPGYLAPWVLPDSPCTAVAASTVGWTVLETPHYTLRLPPDARRISYEEYELRGFSLRVAFNWMEGRTGLGASGPYSTECHMEIGGHEATIVTLWRDAILIQAAWGPIAPSPMGDMGLSVSFRASGLSRYPDIVAIIRSVEFKEVGGT